MSAAGIEIFLSYMSEDRPAVDALHRGLESVPGVRVWRDVAGLIPGDAWLAAIESALRRVDAFVICLGSVAPAGWCQREIEAALTLETGRQALRVVPVLLEGASPERIPLWLQRYLALPIPDPTRSEAVSALLQAVRGEPGAAEAASDPYPRILAAAEAQRSSEMAGLNQKYISALYSPRLAVERELADFVASGAQAILVLGEAGAGKTNLACRLAEEQGAVRPVFFFRARALPGGAHAIAEAIADTLRHYAALSLGMPFFPALKRTLRHPGRRLLVVVDAINEADDPGSFAEALATALYETRSVPIQFCLTCRRSDWRFFRHERRIVDSLWIPGGPTPEGLPGVVLTRFNDTELDDAWCRYQRHPAFCMLGELGAEARTICRHPLMLRFACEAFRGRTLPPLLASTDVFDRYWDAKVQATGDPSRAAGLLDLVAHLRRRKVTSLPETEAIRVVSPAVYDALLSEDIILHVREDSYTRVRHVGFAYEAFHEYCLAKRILIEEQWAELDIPSVERAFARLLAEAERDRLLVGVAEFLLLSLQRHPAFVRMLDAMGASADWKQRLCTLLPRLSRFDATYLPRLTDLAGDAEYWVRWAASFAAAQLRSDADFDALQALWLDFPSPVREAAANASGFRAMTPKRWECLVHLAGDPYWRVRRAAANTLNRHLARGTLALSVLDRLLDDPSWRRRDVGIIAQRHLNVAPAQSCAMLERLVEDDNVRIRFSVAKFAGTIPSAAHFLPLLDRLARDRSAWVRKRVATSAVQFAALDAHGTLGILARLALDPDTAVRWEVARGLTSFAAESAEAVERLLAQLEADPAEDVRFAALFSRQRRSGELPSDFLETLSVVRGQPQAIREAISRVTDLLRPPSQDPDAHQALLYQGWKADYYLGITRGIRLASEQLAASVLDALLRLLLGDAEEGVRWALVQLVGELRLARTARCRLVLTLLRDPHLWVRQAMAEQLTPALLALSPKIPAALADLGRDDDSDLRLSAASIAARLAPVARSSVEPILHQLRGDADAEVRRAAGGEI